VIKRSLFFSLVLFGSAIGFGQENISKTSQNNDIISNFQHLTQQQLLDTANYYQNNKSIDTALVCLSLMINIPLKEIDIEQQKRIIRAYLICAGIYLDICDYRASYDLYIKALVMSEKINDTSFNPRIYNNLGMIYGHFKKFDIAKTYFLAALNMTQDTTGMILLLNNLGANEKETSSDSAFYYLNQSLQLSKQHHNIKSGYALCNIAEIYQGKNLYDSAKYYYYLSLDKARKYNDLLVEAVILSNLGSMFLDIRNIDSSLYYINLSNTISSEKKYLNILADNYLILSKIEEAKGQNKKALEYFKTYADLKDSILSVDKFGEINQLQRLYEVSKTNQQIDQLIIEQQVYERTIHFDKIIKRITIAVLLVMSMVLFIIIFQNRKLRRAYKILFETNIELIESHEKKPEKLTEKQKRKTIKDERLHEILTHILSVMENVAIICDSNFTVDHLAKLVHSNQSYVTDVIKTGLNKNFRSLLNSYRIREAQRLFSEPDAAKYTIETMAPIVGFKSRNSFTEAFKDVVGVSPGFYLKSMREQT
jgi:AraC-like DNA-binding protein/Tfp pilus assembly protein PilF